MSTLAPPSSSAQALEMLRLCLGYLAHADATAMPVAEQVGCLQELERAAAVLTAARTVTLGAFSSGRGFSGDGDCGARSWLVNRTRITRGAASAHIAWAKRAAGHPAVLAAMAAEEVSESWARTVCGWTDKLPEEARGAADEILLAAAAAGLGLGDLARLAGEMYEKSRQDAPDSDGPDGMPFEDRSVTVTATFDGAGVLHGDLTPECAAVVQAVLDALAAPAGAEDTRSHGQRYHDALEEAIRRLVAAGLVPERMGQPVQVLAHVTLADLMRLDGSSALMEEWTTQMRIRWAGHRAAAAEAGGSSETWLDGDAAAGIACDASVTPVVTGEVDPGAFDDLVELCVQFHRLRHRIRSGADGNGDAAGTVPDMAERMTQGDILAWQGLEQAIVGRAVDLLSGPGGLASFLRRRQLGARLAGPSLPLDIGCSENVPAGIRKAIRLRDRHCQWAGGCTQPASACHIHHVKQRAHGGTTSVKGCVLLCPFHHLVAIHRWGWTLVLNPDGTTTAWNKDKTKVLHSHGPPPRPG